MTRIEEIEARRAEIADELVSLREKAEPTSEDLERTDVLLDEKDTLETELAPLVKRQERLATVERVARTGGQTERAFSAPAVHVSADPFDNVTEVVQRGQSGKARERALRAFEDKAAFRGVEVSDEGREKLLDAVDTNPAIAAYALAHGTPGYRAAFVEWVKSEGQTGALSQAHRDAIDDARYVRTALNITTGSSGQYSLPTVFDPSLIHTGTASINPIRALARVETGTQNVWNGVSVGNVTTYWHAEAAALTDGSPTLAHPIVTAGHLTAWVPASWEFFDDSPMVSQLPELIGEAFAYAESDAFVTGTGTSQPLGVVTAISATAASALTATTRGSFTSSSSSEVFRVVNAVSPRFEATASWIGNKATFNVIRQMSSAGYGSLFWGNMINDVTPNPAYPLLGYPTYNSSAVLSTTTTGTVILVLGDFSRYLIYDVVGTTVEFVQNVVNSSGIPTGQRGIVARKRVGGNTTDINAFRFFVT